MDPNHSAHSRLVQDGGVGGGGPHPTPIFQSCMSNSLSEWSAREPSIPSRPRRRVCATASAPPATCWRAWKMRRPQWREHPQLMHARPLRSLACAGEPRGALFDSSSPRATFRLFEPRGPFSTFRFAAVWAGAPDLMAYCVRPSLIVDILC